MKRNSLRNALATLLLAACTAPAQDVPVPEPAAAEPAATHAVPPVLVRDVRVQTIGEERDLEELPPGLIFLDASSGRLMVADDDNPHGRLVCVCRDIDWHSFTNDLRVNGHRILLNAAFSLQAEGGAVSLRHGTNSLLQILAADYGSLAPLTAAYEDPAHLLLTANAPADAVLQTTTNLLDPAGWQPAANAVVAAATDAATTWRITLLDGTVPEFYRVLATVSRPAGLHANAPLHANSGIVMDGTTWTSFPDTNAFLTAETDATALAALAAETSARTAADSALDGAVASAEERIAKLQNDTCTLFWAESNGGLTSSENSYFLPTNFPTPKLTLYVFQRVGSNLTIDLPAWEPDRDVLIEVLAPRAPRSSDNALNFLLIGNAVYTHASYAGTAFRYHYSKDVDRWFTTSWTMNSATTATGNAAPDGSQYTTGGEYLSDAPATVADWLALHPEWAAPQRHRQQAKTDAPQDPETDR